MSSTLATVERLKGQGDQCHNWTDASILKSNSTNLFCQWSPPLPQGKSWMQRRIKLGKYMKMRRWDTMFNIIISYFAINFDRKYPSLKNSHQKFRSSGATTAEDKFEAKRSFQKAMLMQFGQSRSSEIFQMVISFLKWLLCELEIVLGTTKNLLS